MSHVAAKDSGSRMDRLRDARRKVPASGGADAIRLWDVCFRRPFSIKNRVEAIGAGEKISAAMRQKSISRLNRYMTMFMSERENVFSSTTNGQEGTYHRPWPLP